MRACIRDRCMHATFVNLQMRQVPSGGTQLTHFNTPAHARGPRRCCGGVVYHARRDTKKNVWDMRTTSYYVAVAFDVAAMSTSAPRDPSDESNGTRVKNTELARATIACCTSVDVISVFITLHPHAGSCTITRICVVGTFRSVVVVIRATEREHERDMGVGY